MPEPRNTRIAAWKSASPDRRPSNKQPRTDDRQGAAGIDIYYVCDGQDDNLGDIILRRRLLERLQQLGDVRVSVNNASDDFLAALALRDGDVVYRSFKQFVLAVLGSSVRRRKVLYVCNPGEIEASPQQTLINVALAPLLWSVRKQGGGVVRTGAGLRAWHPLWGPVLRATTRISDVTYWRDSRTVRQLGTGAAAPDWAFDLAPIVGRPQDEFTSPNQQERRLLAVSMRSDRPEPSAAWSAGVLAAAETLRLEPVVVSQVRRDDESSARLAARLGCETIGYGTRTHVEQERAVRDVYAGAAAVISDRLHVLALGCVEGAMPVGAFEYVDVKIGRHFENAHLHHVSADVTGWSQREIRDFVVDRSSRTDAVRKGLAAARADLQRIDAEIGEVVTGGPTKRAFQRLRVLLSLAPPDGTTRFVDQVTSGLPSDITPLYFSWRRALLGRYDAFHVHWPDALMRADGVTGIVERFLYAVLLARLSLRRTPVVRTLLNVEPHEKATTLENLLLRRTDKLTSTFVRLNTTTPSPGGASAVTHTILHGHYRDRFAAHPHADADADENTLLFFGLIRAYKGVDALLESFERLSGAWRLRLVGAPQDAALAQRIAKACASDRRVTADLRFVPDDDLVREIRTAEVVVLPYTELHNSGATLVALSLDRPVIVPDTPTTAALAAEVGDAWVIRLPGPLTPASLERAVDTMRAGKLARRTRPVLDERDWPSVGRRHAEVYRQAVGRPAG